MKIEIERKFLVASDEWRSAGRGILYRQGYLCTEPERTVRVRVGGDTAILAVKGKCDKLSRLEFEFPIDFDDAEAILVHCCLQPVISKYRYRVLFSGMLWEIDEFLDANQGLVLAEVELENVNQPVDLPPWIGREVTGDPRYYNASLARHPYTSWIRQDLGPLV